uniref:SPASM domain-containing protein n=1 Tax=Agathobacter sp. TaxID=2021311 RepID=UPI004056ECFD
MKKLEELLMIEGNKKVILLNRNNWHWARMPKEKYDLAIADPIQKEKLEKLLDEKFQLFDEAENGEPQIRSIYYSVTGKCNLNCEFCTMNSGIDVSTEKDLTLREIQDNLIPKLKKLNPRKVIITGGEPLIRKDANEIIKSFSKAFGKEKVILQSNGLLLTCNQLLQLVEDIGLLEVSIENIFESNQQQNHMEKIFAYAKHLCIPLSFSFVVDSNTRKYLYDAIELCHKYGAALTTRVVALVGRAIKNNNNDDILEEENTLQVQCDIVGYLIEKGYFEDTLTNCYVGNLYPKRNCGAFGNILAIHPDGTTYMCSNFKEKRYSMGNIRFRSIEKISENLYEKIKDDNYRKEFFVDRQKMCTNCKMMYFCIGPCTAEVAENRDNMEQMEKKCFATKAMLSYAMFYYDSHKSVEQNLKVLEKYLHSVLDKRDVSF